MDALRVAMAQINPTVGDLAGNARLVHTHARRAVDDGAAVVVFGEMALTGYPVEDLALRRSFRDAAEHQEQALAADLDAEGLGDLTVVVGSVGTDGEGRPTNTAVVLQGGQVRHRYVKRHLPNYGVFDDYRVFAAGAEPLVIEVAGARLAVAICEDLWQDQIVQDLKQTSPDGLLVLNASPFERGKVHRRGELVRRRAAQLGCAVMYVNIVGGQDDLVFDGGSFAVEAGGEVLAGAPLFTEDTLTLDLAGAPRQSLADHGSDVAQMYDAVVLGLGDYVRKNGFTSVITGLSGGIDSTLVAAIAADAIGPENVVGISMPSAYSSEHSRTDAADLARRLKMPEANYRTVPIAAMVDAFQGEMGLSGIAEENLQARIRAVVLMGLSNSEGHLVLANGNKSELAVGYSTIYGDAVGGYAPIKDVSKSRVWELSRFRNERARQAGQEEPIPPNTITKAPSAELRPGQRDDETLPDYAVLDPVLEAYVEHARSRQEMLDEGFPADVIDLVLSLVDRSEWKRRQYPPGPKVTSLAFGRDRRLPLTSAFREYQQR